MQEPNDSFSLAVNVSARDQGRAADKSRNLSRASGQSDTNVRAKPFANHAMIPGRAPARTRSMTRTRINTSFA